MQPERSLQIRSTFEVSGLLRTMMRVDHRTLDLFGKMLFEKAILDAPFKRQVPMPNEACFLYLLDGEYNSISESSLIKVQPKEALLMKCGNYLGQFLVSKTTRSYEAMAVHFYPEVLKKAYTNALPEFLKNPQQEARGPGMAKVLTTVLLKNYVDSILFYFENPELATEELLILKLKELIIILSQTREAPALLQILSQLFSPATYSFKEIIDAHVLSSVSIQELAQLTNLSLSTFKREFKKIYRQSPASYLKDKKLEKAREFILLSDRNITQITFDCGFKDVAHFSKCFKDKYGLPPSQFRMAQIDKSLS